MRSLSSLDFLRFYRLSVGINSTHQLGYLPAFEISEKPKETTMILYSQTSRQIHSSYPGKVTDCQRLKSLVVCTDGTSLGIYPFEQYVKFEKSSSSFFLSFSCSNTYFSGKHAFGDQKSPSTKGRKLFPHLFSQHCLLSIFKPPTSPIHFPLSY